MTHDQLVTSVGFATVFVAIAVKAVGLPDQIRKNHKLKSTEGLSTPFFALGLVSYLLWTIYGVLRGDWVVAIGQGVGVITMGIIAYQIWIYKGRAS